MKYMLGLLVAVSLIGCTPSEKAVEEALKKKPEILFQVIRDNPKEFMETVQEAARKGRPQPPDPEKQMEEEMKNPKTPEIEPNRVLGDASAPITIVEYTDLECPFCARGHQTMEELKKTQGPKIKVIRKHLPLPMHSHAKDLAVYYELIARQDLRKADIWAGLVFQNQKSLADANLMDNLAKQAGVDVKRLKKEKNDQGIVSRINDQIQKDMQEAQKYGFQGTPGYLVNGVGVRGAYPIDYFNKLIQKLGK